MYVVRINLPVARKVLSNKGISVKDIKSELTEMKTLVAENQSVEVPNFLSEKTKTESNSFLSIIILECS